MKISYQITWKTLHESICTSIWRMFHWIFIMNAANAKRQTTLNSAFPVRITSECVFVGGGKMEIWNVIRHKIQNTNYYTILSFEPCWNLECIFVASMKNLLNILHMSMAMQRQLLKWRHSFTHFHIESPRYDACPSTFELIWENLLRRKSALFLHFPRWNPFHSYYTVFIQTEIHY